MQDYYEVIVYRSPRGEAPVVEFLRELDQKSRMKVFAFLQMLQREGPNLKRPYADKVRGKICELRIPYRSSQFRVLYFFWMKDKVVLLHGFRKKSQKIKASEIGTAENRMLDWITRYGEQGERKR